MQVTKGNDMSLSEIYRTTRMDPDDYRHIKERLERPGWTANRTQKANFAQQRAFSAKKGVTLPKLKFLEREV